MEEARSGNAKLAAVVAEARWSHAQVARAFGRVAAENGAREFAAVGRSHVSKWVAGSHPSGWAPTILAEALTRRLGRVVTIDEIGLAAPSLSSSALDWSADTLMAMTALGRVDVDVERRHILGAAAYSVAALALPDRYWWTELARRGRDRVVPGSRAVGRGELESVREVVSAFSRIDQRRGGGHARTAVVQYLISDVASYLRGHYSDERTRREMFSAASELAYLAGWMAFDNTEHRVAQNYFTVAVKLAAEADNPPMVGHILRAMAHQAVDLGHYQQGHDLAAASMDGERYALACPRERSLLGVVYAKSLAATGQKHATAKALTKAEDDLAAAAIGDDEPARVFFFSEASLAHETACTMRYGGDLDGAMREFGRSVRTRQAATFTRTHAVTLGYLGAVQVCRGSIEEACATWSDALGAMDGIHSGRARQAVADMRSTLSALRGRGVPAATELYARASTYLNAAL